MREGREEHGTIFYERIFAIKIHTQYIYSIPHPLVVSWFWWRMLNMSAHLSATFTRPLGGRGKGEVCHHLTILHLWRQKWSSSPVTCCSQWTEDNVPAACICGPGTDWNWVGASQTWFMFSLQLGSAPASLSLINLLFQINFCTTRETADIGRQG